MAFIELDRSALFYNLGIIAQQTRSVDKIALVLKDNAYGHGLQPMAEMAAAFGIRRAVVRYSGEAEAVAHLFEDILVLAEVPETVNDRFRYALNAAEEIDRFPMGSRIEIKTDTGMHRNGTTIENLEAVFEAVAERGLKVEGVFTHHRGADTLSSEWFWQQRQFDAIKEKAAALARRYGFGPLRFHGSNSASLFRHRQFDEDLARVGIAAYGCLEMGPTLPQPDLRPVLSLYGEKIASRSLGTGERVGYNGIYAADGEETVSTYDVGYADGLLRTASNRYTTPGGAAQRGRISMDNASFAATDNRLLIFDNANVFAEAAGTIGYEVLVGMRPHIRRVIKR
jgi:alanine racemase